MHQAKRIIQKDKQGLIVATHENVKVAAATIGIKYKTLYAYIYNGSGSLYHGFFWEFHSFSDVKGKVRQCLGIDCSKKFMSSGFFNRFCPACHNSANHWKASYKINL